MLYERIIGQGTINEPKGKPQPHFALPSTVNWMRALCIQIEDNGLNFTHAKAYYINQGKRGMPTLEENTVLEQLFLSLHHLSALEAMANTGKTGDLERVGILAWYYGISNAASAMIAAQSGSFQEDHAGTARLWDSDIAARNLAMEPFSWRVSSLLKKTIQSEVATYASGSPGKLTVKPITAEDARGAAAGYLSGSASWYAWRATENVRRMQEFKDLGVTDFRKKVAQELRDTRLEKQSMGFVHQASRYRGKANYREALFLAYGKSTGKILEGFVTDQAIVLRAFLAMAGAFASKKLGKTLWNEFVADVDANRAFSTKANSVWK